MSSLNLDHIIIVVSDLSAATRQFTQLGFLVIPGGVHSGGLTHNALIPFADGTYLELLATTRFTSFRLITILKKLHLLNIYTANQTAINRRIIENIASGVGLNDYALLSNNLDPEIEMINQRGQNFTDPISGGRIRPDGQEIIWRTSVPQTLDIPFLIEDITPRELRVPQVDENAHANGVSGTRGLSILVPNLVDSIARYRELLGEDPKTQPSHSQPGTQSTEYMLGRRLISLSSPLPDNSALRHLLRHRPSRPIGLLFNNKESSEDDFLSLTYFPDKGATLSHSHTYL
jgi:hypothetical protein